MIERIVHVAIGIVSTLVPESDLIRLSALEGRLTVLLPDPATGIERIAAQSIRPLCIRPSECVSGTRSPSTYEPRGEERTRSRGPW
jgi:hypothetical protein